jgi:hypothetical protein
MKGIEMFDATTLSPSQQILLKGYRQGLFTKMDDIAVCKKLGKENSINWDNLRKTWKGLKPMLPLLFPEDYKTQYISYATRIEKPLLDELQRRNREGSEKIVKMINTAISEYLDK